VTRFRRRSHPELLRRVVLGTVNPWHRKPLLSVLLALGAPAAIAASPADPMAATQLLREGGCGGILPPARPLHHLASLDRAAEQWAAGRSLSAAAERSGYEAQAASGLRISGPDSATVQLLKRASCSTITNPALHDIGIYHHGSVTWLVLASASVIPTISQAPILASRALQLVNEVRARGARCGERSFGPAPPVKLSGTLAGVALGHADDMARHNYFEHKDLTGHSPADRVRAVGYQETLVGENIAYGPKSADEVVQGWLDSPGHCENIMDPRFAEMGIAYAAGKASKRGLFWVQVLAVPKA
jgi:uncharacterized protein YkwD